LAPGDQSQVVERGTCVLLVTELALHRKVLLEMISGRVVVACRPRQDSRAVAGRRAQCARAFRTRQCAFEPTAALGDVAADVPEPVERGGESEPRLGFGRP